MISANEQKLHAHARHPPTHPTPHTHREREREREGGREGGRERERERRERELSMASPQGQLFEPLQLRNLRLRNRSVVSPMCQYTAEDGKVGGDKIVLCPSVN